MMPAGDQGKARGYFSDGAQPKAWPGSQQSMSLGKRVWFGFSWLALGAFLAGLNRLEVTGAEHVPPGGGVLLAANHLSLVDTLLIPWVNIAKVRLEVVWAPAKAELFDIPVINHHYQLGCFSGAAWRARCTSHATSRRADGARKGYAVP